MERYGSIGIWKKKSKNTAPTETMLPVEVAYQKEDNEHDGEDEIEYDDVHRNPGDIGIMWADDIERDVKSSADNEDQEK